nr:CAP domain-containing protein [Actinomycetota bacterium]
MAAQSRKLVTRVAIVVSLALALSLYIPSTSSEANVASGNTAPTTDLSGYAWINYFRSLGGLGTVTRDASIESQESLHVRYLANHSLSCETNVHDELTARTGSCGANPYATAAGKAAANNSNITRINASIPDRAAVENWFTSAFHALTLLEPRLKTTGYAAYYTAKPTGAKPDAYNFTAAVDVYRGRTGSYGGQELSFPASGAVSPLLSYQIGTESPEPFQSTLASSACHSWGTKSVVSAPIIIQWALNSKAPQTAASIVDLSTGAALPTCALTAAQYPAGSLAQEFLLGTNRVTKAALYYTSAPFVAGHRYQLQVAGAAVTSFTTSNLPSVPALTGTPATRSVKLNWTLPTAGTGTVAYYRLSRFT